MGSVTQSLSPTRSTTARPTPSLAFAEPGAMTMPAGARACLSMEEAADALCICRNKLYEYANSGALSTIVLGRRRVVPVASVHAFVARMLADQGQRL